MRKNIDSIRMLSLRFHSTSHTARKLSDLRRVFAAALRKLSIDASLLDLAEAPWATITIIVRTISKGARIVSKVFCDMSAAQLIYKVAHILCPSAFTDKYR
jgi:hypothetical protein